MLLNESQGYKVPASEGCLQIKELSVCSLLWLMSGLAPVQHTVQHGRVARPLPSPFFGPCPLSNLHKEVTPNPQCTPGPAWPSLTATAVPMDLASAWSRLLSISQPSGVSAEKQELSQNLMDGGAYEGARGFPRLRTPGPAANPELSSHVGGDSSDLTAQPPGPICSGAAQARAQESGPCHPLGWQSSEGLSHASKSERCQGALRQKRAEGDSGSLKENGKPAWPEGGKTGQRPVI